MILNVPTTIFYILIFLITSSSIILYFLSRRIIQQEKVEKNYDEVRNTCKFKFLTKKDRKILDLIYIELLEYMYKKSIDFKFMKNERFFKFKDFEESYKGQRYLRMHGSLIKYKLEVVAVEEKLQIKFI